MNHSWNNNSNNASGFVYYNTSDFLAFSDSYNSPKCNRFSPVHYSSPNKFQKNPRNFHGRPPGRNSFRYHNSRDSNSFNSSNRSFSSSFNNSRKKSGHQHTKSPNSFNNNGKKDMSIYFDHTSLKNPWMELEQKLKKTQEAEIKVDPAAPEKENSDVEENSSSSGDEQESESEVKTSSSEPEEGTT